ncbi:hypothetical protein ABGB17_21330 [Sphaerisporangium sp. B11E5]|uniref:hypothetical protein n=1 Tax=Sphaerisporangium sp. B11E5 TaxID=3153563 RepID=UPI00325C84FC
MTGDEERHHLIPDVVVVQPPAGLRVDGFQHQTQQVVPAAGPPPAAFHDDLLDHVPHRGDALAVPLAVGLTQPRHHRKLLGAPHRLGQRVQHRLDEGVQLFPVEGAEPVAEARQGDGVQGQPGVVVGDVDRLPLPVFPLASCRRCPN